MCIDGETVKDILEGRVRLVAPKGMGFYQGVLYVADIDRLVGIDLTRKGQVWQVSFAEKGVGFLNDVAISDAGMLYVSATDAGKMFTVDLTADQFAIASLPLPTLPGPNGLYFDAAKRRLIAASFGTDTQLGVVDLVNRPGFRGGHLV